MNNKLSLQKIALLLLFTFSVAGCSSTSTNETPEVANTETEITTNADSLNADAAELEEDDLFAEEDDFLDEDGDVIEVEEDSDPLYYFNKAMFVFNDKLYFWVVKPTATAYKAVTPAFFRTGVENFFHNLSMPIRFTNTLLQGDLEGSGTELGRFVVNTTVGVLGFMDPAEEYLEWEPSQQDFGLTLGKYGVGNGPYVVWPLLGPSTMRDTVGLGGDYFLSPLTYTKPAKVGYIAEGTRKINKASMHIGDYETFKKAYIDPYARMKEFYLEYRAERVAAD